MDPVQRAIDLAIDRLGVDRGAPVVVACSGGPDSSALAHAAMVLARAGRLGPVTLCHVDHRLRPGSADEAELVARLAASGGAGFVTVGIEVDRRHASLEMAARDARYRALEEVAAARSAAAVLVGHTADDQAETVLMRILSGTGLAGLAGMPERRGLFARPLIRLAREQVADYCRRQRIDTAHDPSNLDMRYFRNRVRHQILPSLRAENPRLDRALVALASRAAEVDEVLDADAASLLTRSGEADGSWDVASLAAAPRLVSARALALAAARAGAGPLSIRHLAALDALLRRATGGSASLDLPGGRAVREYARVRFTARADDPAPPPPELHVTGRAGPYEVRLVRPGDRMQPARLRGRSRKLSDLFVDARVPRRLRPGARVVVRSSDGRIEWAEHIGPAHASEVDVTLTPSGTLATNKAR